MRTNTAVRRLIEATKLLKEGHITQGEANVVRSRVDDLSERLETMALSSGLPIDVFEGVDFFCREGQFPWVKMPFDQIVCLN